MTAKRTALFQYRYSLLLCCMLLPGIRPLWAVQPASQPDSLCPPDYQLKIPKPDPSLLKDQSTHVDADSATVSSSSITRFSGNVVVRQGDKQLKASEIVYDHNKNEVTASGKVEFTTGESMVKGSQAQLNLQTSQGKIENARYRTGTVNGRGEARTINLEGKHRLSLDKATYTTCPAGHVVWALHASKIELNNQNHQGTAENTVLNIGHVPVLYLPYIRFPIGTDRLSGFLYPALSSSQNNGTETIVPYYWNIAPNMDATITLDNMSRRGLMLENQFRYLTPDSHGSVELDYMGMDTLYGDSRAKFDWTHQGQANAGWSTSVDYHYVSDNQYLSDFTSSLTATSASITALNRQGTLSYNQSAYQFTASLQDYQTISGTDQYTRLPQLTFDTRLFQPDNHWNYNFDSQFVNFNIREPGKVTGQRVKLSPYISYPVVKSAGFIKPKLTLNYLQYNLKQPSGSSQPNNPAITVPVFSLDSGLHFERDTRIAGTRLTQTLEPRLYYLYAPYRDQSQLPVFDTALTTFSRTLLFSENRFSGNDRIGDANQVTAALTTRLYRRDNGAELFDATLGQIFYFSDRQVVLPGQAVDTTTRSSYLGAVNFTPTPHWNLNGDAQYNPNNHQIEVGNVSLQYRPGPGRVVNLQYRYTLNQLRTEGASFAWRLSPRWQIFAGTQYDVLNKHRLQNFAGLRYDSCCWGIRLVGGERFNSVLNNDPNNPVYEHAIYLEFMLKGLSSLGSGKDIDTLLENGILGYSQ
ncbi:MAG: LPS-assembly protein LptD [Gammaproteobacteria bacterium]